MSRASQDHGLQPRDASNLPNQGPAVSSVRAIAPGIGDTESRLDDLRMPQGAQGSGDEGAKPSEPSGLRQTALVLSCVANISLFSLGTVISLGNFINLDAGGTLGRGFFGAAMVLYSAYRFLKTLQKEIN